MLKALNSHRELLICLLLIVTILTVFWPVKNHDFINYDDTLYITKNSHVQGGLTFAGLKWAFTSTLTGNWHPLTWLSHMLDCQLFGLKPGWHHLMNLFFHIANTLLLFLVLHRMTKALWQCAFVAALFALHPLHVESVAWVAERKDVLSTFFWMLTMGAYVYYVEHPRPLRYIITLIFFALGLMAKPMLVTLPFVLLLLDYWPLKRFSFHKADTEIHAETLKPAAPAKQKQKSKKQLIAKKKVQAKNHSDSLYEWTSIRPLIWEKVPFFALTTIFSVLAYLTQQKEGAMAALKVIPFDTRVTNALVSYVSYLGKMIWPQDLVVFYPHPGMLPPWQVFGAAAFLLIVTFPIIWTARRFPYLLVGWLWYLGTLVPVIGIVQVGQQAMADRYTYVTLVGLFIIAAWGLPPLVKKNRHRKVFLGVSAGFVLVAFTFVTWTQVRYWQNSITLFEHALDVTKNNHVSHDRLGSALDDQGRIDEAIGHYSESLRINPNQAPVYNNLGVALKSQGKTGEAILQFKEALKISPNDVTAFFNLGCIMTSQGKTHEAMSFFQKALDVDPDDLESHVMLGNALASGGNPDEALVHYSKALEIKRDYAEIHYNMGVILASKKSFHEAVYHFREVLRIEPDHAMAHNNLGSLLASKGEIKEAIHHFQEAVRIQPTDKMAKDNLNQALAQQQKSK
jgi:tetratricopeptide (TPR) repeat protein